MEGAPAPPSPEADSAGCWMPPLKGPCVKDLVAKVVLLRGTVGLSGGLELSEGG